MDFTNKLCHNQPFEDIHDLDMAENKFDIPVLDHKTNSNTRQRQSE